MKFKSFKHKSYGPALVDTGNLVKNTLVSSEFWEMIGGKMFGNSNACVGTAKKEGKGLLKKSSRKNYPRLYYL